MGEEVNMSEYRHAYSSDDGDEDRVMEWERGLPEADDLTPLSQSLIPPELASAFSISPESCRTVVDVDRASRSTVSNLRGGNLKGIVLNDLKGFNENEMRDGDTMVIQGDETDRDGDGSGSGSGNDLRKLRKADCVEEADSALRIEDSGDDQSARNSKRPRLVWTPQLHKRFVDVVAHLGIKSAVPKTIMQLMNVEGLTRENVASHLQKYRLYLKRMQGLSNEGPSPSDQLFASTPVPQSLNDSSGSVQASRHDAHVIGNTPVPIPMPYPPPVMPIPIYGVAMGHGQMGTPGNSGGGYHGFEAHLYNMMQQRDWSGNKYGSVPQYPHVGQNDS